MKTLILNADYTPIDIISWKKAFQKVYSETDAVYVIEYYNKSIRDSMNREYYIPAVCVLKDYIRASDIKATYNKTNIYNRDKYTCQYCGIKFTRDKLTIDHIIPKSRWVSLGNKGTSSCFENVVTACYPCNSKKRNRTPNEAKMPLLKQPNKLTRKQAFLNKISCYEVPDKWKVI